MKNIEHLRISFHKYINNEFDEVDAREFLEQIKSDDNKDILLTLIEENLSSPVLDDLLNKPELFALLNQSFAKISDVIEQEPKKSVFKLWMRVAASVAAVVVLGIAGLYLFKDKNNVQPNYFTKVQDIAPGKVGATLTLANGRKIKLADVANGEVAKEAGISVTKTVDGELVYEIKGSGANANTLNTLTTAKGETYMVTLPDKSKVWMNAASTLTYATSLTESIRKVKLDGEAYFEITEDKTHPFIVETRKQIIEVLGTHFNVNSYFNEGKVTTTLLEGSVKVTNETGFKILKPGNQSAVNESSILIADVDTERAIAWKNNKFIFENDDIKYVMRMIERWYDVDVVYSGELPTEKYGGGVSRFDKASQVLKILENAGGVHFKIDGRKIVVSK